MHDMITNALEVPKENISTLSFTRMDVLDDFEMKRERSSKIHRATSLGNLEKHKVIIFFRDSEGPKKVFTTIWAHTDNKVILKGGTTIPVSSIIDIRFF